MNAELIPIREHGGKQAVSGRELHVFLQIGRDYTNWFKQMVEYGFTEGQDFTPITAKSTGGRPSVDHALTLDMGKQLGMIQRTDLGRQIREYFIAMEKRAQGAPALPDLSTPEGVLALAQTLTQTAQQLVEAKHEVAVLAPKAGAWDDLASAEGDYEVADAAKMLARAGIETGQRRLFEQLRAGRWIFRGSHGKWRAYQDKVDAGLLAELPQWHFLPKTGEKVIDPPQVRVTVNGLEKLRATMKPATELGAVA